MGVARLVGESVVLAVIRHPLGHRPLHRHAAENRQQRLDGGARLEAAVREEPMKSDRRSERAEDVHAREEGDVDPVEADAPEQAHRQRKAERRHDDRDQRHDLADPARARADGSDSSHRFSSAASRAR
jgi:hypothetical protein